MKRRQGTRPDYKRNSVGILGIILAGLLMVGCTFTVPLSATVDRPPGVSRIPLAVGVYYSPEFRAYTSTHVKRAGLPGLREWNYPVGQVSVTLFDHVFPILFDQLRSSSGRPPLKAVEPALAAVIEPSIEEFSVGVPLLSNGIFTAEITYRFILFSSDGNRVASWTVRGVGEKHGAITFVDWSAWSRWQGEAADLAMQDAAKEFLTGFRNVPEIRRWFRQIGVPDAREVSR